MHFKRDQEKEAKNDNDKTSLLLLLLRTTYLYVQANYKIITHYLDESCFINTT